jgi:phenylalanyl-tRNA synthetase beta subunit
MKKVMQEFVKKVKEKYSDKLEKIVLFSSYVGEKLRKKTMSICWLLWRGLPITGKKSE